MHSTLSMIPDSLINGWKAAATRLGISLEEYAKNRLSGRLWCCVHGAFLPEKRFPKKTRGQVGQHVLPAICCSCKSNISDLAMRLALQSFSAEEKTGFRRQARQSIKVKLKGKQK